MPEVTLLDRLDEIENACNDIRATASSDQEIWNKITISVDDIEGFVGEIINLIGHNEDD